MKHLTSLSHCHYIQQATFVNWQQLQNQLATKSSERIYLLGSWQQCCWHHEGQHERTGHLQHTPSVMFHTLQPWRCHLQHTSSVMFHILQPWRCHLQHTPSVTFHTLQPWRCHLQHTPSVTFHMLQPWRCHLRHTPSVSSIHYSPSVMFAAVAHAGTDRWTGGWTPYHVIDPALHTMWAVPKNLEILNFVIITYSSIGLETNKQCLSPASQLRIKKGLSEVSNALASNSWPDIRAYLVKPKVSNYKMLSHLVGGIVWRWPHSVAGHDLLSSDNSQSLCTTGTSQTFIQPQHTNYSLLNDHLSWLYF